jgi:release factor glutamine methyltransferase
MNIQEAIKKGQITLKSKKIKTPELDSQILMSKTFNEDKKFVILNSQDKISKKNLDFFNILINQRAKGKPIAYLLKKKEFWKYEFFVNKNVLIPRPDTEILIEQCLQITKNKNKLNILDIGVGSGCILLSILKEKKNFYGSGVDISNKSLDICKINTHKLG